MPSTRRTILVAGGIALAGCSETDPGDGTTTETGERQTTERRTLRLEEATADEITPEDTVGSFGPLLTDVLNDMVDIAGTEPAPFVVGGRVEIHGQHHGETPPFEPFEAVEIGDENLVIDIESAPPFRFTHVAEPVDDVPSDAPVIDTTDHPDRVVEPIVEAIESGSTTIAGWSAAFQLLDDNAHEGSGFDDATAYTRHGDERYRIDRETFTPTPFPGYAFIVRAARGDRDPDAVLSPFDPEDGVRAELETAVENGTIRDAASETIAAVEPYDYLLSDYGFFGFQIETVESEARID